MTCELFPALTEDDRLLAGALAERGHEPVVWDWMQPRPDAVDLTVLRSPWNYPEQRARFDTWLAQAAADGPLFNRPRAVAWNVHKRYLQALERAGVPVVPTEVLARGSEATLDEVLARRSWGDVVVKPAVGGSSRATVQLARVGAEQAAAHLRALLAREDVVVQPFLSAVLSAGELSLVFFAGAFSHAVRKRARPGDWRVQSDFGGTAEPVDPPAQALRAARAAIAAGPDALYARVDLITDGGEALVIEHELVDCELFLGTHPPAAGAFAQVICAHAAR